MTRTIANIPEYVNEVWLWLKLDEDDIDLLRRTQVRPQPGWPKPTWKGILLDAQGATAEVVATKVFDLFTTRDQVEFGTGSCLWWKGTLMRYDGHTFTPLPSY